MAHRFIRVNNTRLHYNECGTGRPLVLIHAGIAHLDMWDDQVEAFSEHYRTIRYDVRGYGRSASPAGAYSDVEDLHEMLIKLGVEGAAIVGASIGGQIATNFALAYPGMVDKLVLVASSLEGYEYDHIDSETERRDAVCEKAIQNGNKELIAEMETQIWVDGPRRDPSQVDPGIRSRALEMNLFNLKQTPAQGEKREKQLATIDRLGQIKVPTLAIVGDQDLEDMQMIAERLAKGIPGALKVVIPGVGHLPNIEKPSVFNQIVMDFLGTRR